MQDMIQLRSAPLPPPTSKPLNCNSIASIQLVSSPLQLNLILHQQRSHIAVRHTKRIDIHLIIRTMIPTVTQESILRRPLNEFALRVMAIRAGHVPGEGLQLGQASGVHASDIDGDVDGGAVAALGVAGEGVLEEELAGGVVGQELGDGVAPVAVHVRELVEAEAHVEVAGVPPGAADVLLVVGLAADVVV